MRFISILDQDFVFQVLIVIVEHELLLEKTFMMSWMMMFMMSSCSWNE